MSLYLEFEPHSWYGGAAIQKVAVPHEKMPNKTVGYIWNAYLENGWNYTILEFSAKTLKELKNQIRLWHVNEQSRIERLYSNDAITNKQVYGGK